MVIDGLVSVVTRALQDQGLFGALKVLNATTPYRFTGMYRFDGKWVKSIWLYDREHPNIEFGSDVLWDDSYCRLTATDGDVCEITNALRDGRLTTHAARQQVQSYVAVALKRPDGGMLGTLCHYDVCPRDTPAGTFDTLRAVRPAVERAIWAQLTDVGDPSLVRSPG